MKVKPLQSTTNIIIQNFEKENKKRNKLEIASEVHKSQNP